MDTKYFELTNSQFMMWTGQQLNPDTPLYNEALLWEIDGSIDPKRFQDSFQQLINRTESLRLTFHQFDEGPKQCVLENLAHRVEYLDWSDNKDRNELINLLEARTERVLISPNAALTHCSSN